MVNVSVSTIDATVITNVMMDLMKMAVRKVELSKNICLMHELTKVIFSKFIKFYHLPLLVISFQVIYVKD